MMLLPQIKSICSFSCRLGVITWSGFCVTAQHFLILCLIFISLLTWASYWLHRQIRQPYWNFMPCERVLPQMLACLTTLYVRTKYHPNASLVVSILLPNVNVLGESIHQSINQQKIDLQLIFLIETLIVWRIRIKINWIKNGWLVG